MHNRSLTLTLALAYSLFVCPSLRCLGADEEVGEVTRVKGLVASIRNAQGDILTVFKVARVFSENEKRGFLRLGILSHLVCDGVTIELRDQMGSEHLLRRITERLGGRDLCHTLQIREVRIFSWENSERYLGCHLARPQADGSWKLFEVHWVDSDGVAKHLPEAVLKTTPAGFRLEHGPECWCIEFYQHSSDK